MFILHLAENLTYKEGHLLVNEYGLMIIKINGLNLNSKTTHAQVI